MSAIIYLVLLFACGVLAETDMAELQCLVGDVTYEPGESIPDRCNRCWCTNGVKACTKMECVERQSCVVDDVTYASGDSVPDPCNICYCYNGNVACTLRLCLPDMNNVE